MEFEHPRPNTLSCVFWASQKHTQLEALPSCHSVSAHCLAVQLQILKVCKVNTHTLKHHTWEDWLTQAREAHTASENVIKAQLRKLT
jgi:hypothetical protein